MANAANAVDRLTPPRPQLARPRRAGRVVVYASAARRVAPPLGESARDQSRWPHLFRRALALIGLAMMLLVLPTTAAACNMGPANSTAATGVCGAHYAVRAGDTLSAIALRCGVALAALQSANPHSDPLAVGRLLELPAGGTITAPALVARATPPQAAPLATRPVGQRYAVRSGDTLSAIAARFATTPAALAHSNGLANANSLQVGQMLVIPGHLTT